MALKVIFSFKIPASRSILIFKLSLQLRLELCKIYQCHKHELHWLKGALQAQYKHLRDEISEDKKHIYLFDSFNSRANRFD